jgi:hypothetical protein
LRDKNNQSIQFSLSEAALNRGLNEATRTPRLIRSLNAKLLERNFIELNVQVGVSALLATSFNVKFELCECVHDYSRSEIVIKPSDNTIAMALNMLERFLPQYEKRDDKYVFNMRRALIRLLSGSRMFGRPLLDVIKITSAETANNEITIFAELTD